MQLWRPESKLDGIKSGSWYHCLPVPIGNDVSLIRRGRLYVEVVCEVVCYAEVRPGKNDVALQ